MGANKYSWKSDYKNLELLTQFILTVTGTNFSPQTHPGILDWIFLLRFHLLLLRGAVIDILRRQLTSEVQYKNGSNWDL